MAEYRQNTDYNEIIDDDGSEDEAKKKRGNTGLPFGLCAKYGISLPENATPREAWDALKGIGIYPPWTKEGAGQYIGDDTIKDDTNDVKDDKVKISPTRKETYEQVSNRLKEGKFSSEFRDEINSVLMNLTDAELEVFALTDDVYVFSMGARDGTSFCRAGKEIQCSEYPSVADKELGYTKGILTFGHEYGHAVDWHYGEATGNYIEGRISQQKDCKQAYSEDVLNYFNAACEDAGVPTMKSIDRITREQKTAIWNKMRKDSGRDTSDYKPLSSFVQEPPREPYYMRIKTDTELWEDARRYLSDNDDIRRMYERSKASREEAEKRNALLKENYEKQLREYNEYIKTDEYKRGLAQYEAYEANRKANAQKSAAKLYRFGIISDFIGEITQGKFDVINSGYSAHSVTYYKQRNFQKGAETWATFFGMKIARDTQGLEMMKRLLPKTYKVYNKHYSQIAKVLSGKGETR